MCLTCALPLLPQRGSSFSSAKDDDNKNKHDNDQNMHDGSSSFCVLQAVLELCS
jgi:hypothetical protein